MSTATRESDDVAQITDVLQRWAIARDAGLWDDLRATFHADGWINTTWMHGTADEFVAASRNAFERGVIVHHLLAGSLVTVSGARAVAQTRMVIEQRSPVHGVLCDIRCTGRFYDLLERTEAGWLIRRRQPIYEKDRIDPVRPGQPLLLDEDELARYPEGCRFLLYAQAHGGMNVLPDVPGRTGPALDALYERGANWLAGRPMPNLNSRRN